VGSVKIPYYVVAKGRGYWRPTKRMQALGFSDVRCGQDGPAAWQIARQWADRWERVRTGEEGPPTTVNKLTREQAEAARRYPPGSIGDAFQRYIRSAEWAGKAQSTRTKVWWPAWFRIRDMWGDVAPDTITFDMMSEWRSGLEKKHGRGVAHKTLKIWRALWKVMLGQRIAKTADPTTGVRNRGPQPRHQRWSEGEAVRLVKTAWRSGYRGLACVIAIAWDTQFSPVDVRTLAERHRMMVGGRLVFDRQADGRAKTGRPAFGTLSRRTEKLVSVYLASFGADRLPDAVLFRTRSGGPYREDTLGDDFASVRSIAFPGDTRRLSDMRRSGAVEAIVGEVDALGLAAKMANSIERSNELHKTYAPGDLASVQRVDDARVRGRRKMRATTAKKEP
jgi:hypothetical protein